MFPLNMKRKLLFCLLIIVLVSSSGCDSKNTPQSQADKAFKVEQDEKGKFWFVDPAGRRFLSIGINNVTPSAWNPRPNTVYYDAVNTVFDGDIDKWKESVNNILTENGFNTLGAWSDPNLYDEKTYGTIILYVAGYSGDRCFEGLRPGFEDKVRRNTQLMLSRYRSIENVFGFFLDNEMPWYGTSAWDNIPTYTLLEVAVGLSPEDGAHQAARQFLMGRYKTAKAFSEAWGRPLESWDKLDIEFLRRCLNDKTQADRDAFTAYAADKFFDIASRVVRQMVPGKLTLGTRFGGHAPEPVVRACGKYCDVISFNSYRRLPKADEDQLARFWTWGGKRPLMVTEYSWRGEENTSGNPNTGGAGSVVKTQAERAANYRAYVEDLLSYPMVVGAHWFEFADQSPQGRFDGENSNYGVVDTKHRLYTELLEAMAKTNALVDDIHARSTRKSPTSLPKQRPVVFEPGQHPERPPYIDLIAEEAIQTPELFYANDANISFQRDGDSAVVRYDTGQLWGCGILFFGPKSLAVGRGPKHATDIDGYSVVAIDAEIPKNLSFELFVDEAGVAAPGAETYNTNAGDDGESFLFKTVFGKGKRHTYMFALKDLLPRTEWGNQKGRRCVDLYAMKGLALYFRGLQGSGTIKLYSFRLER